MRDENQVWKDWKTNARKGARIAANKHLEAKSQWKVSDIKYIRTEWKIAGKAKKTEKEER